jgi:hypothetical protein
MGVPTARKSRDGITPTTRFQKSMFTAGITGNPGITGHPGITGNPGRKCSTCGSESACMIEPWKRT